MWTVNERLVSETLLDEVCFINYVYNIFTNIEAYYAFAEEGNRERTMHSLVLSVPFMVHHNLGNCQLPPNNDH